jgi:hypothetical protein
MSRIFCSGNRIIDGQRQLKMATEVDWDFKLMTCTQDATSRPLSRLDESLGNAVNIKKKIQIHVPCTYAVMDK